MNQTLSDLIRSFSPLNVLVIGEAMLDSYLEGSASRLCPEAPVPVVSNIQRIDVPGGAANTAANVAALGANAMLLSVAGDDAEESLLRRALEQRGVVADGIVVEPGRRTLAKHRVLAGAQILVRYDRGDTTPISRAAEDTLIDRIGALYPHCAAIVVSDYRYGILTPRVIDALASLQARYHRILAVDSKDLRAYRRAGVTAAKPNYRQAMDLLGLDGFREGSARVAQIGAHGEALLDGTGAEFAAVTLDADGALVAERGCPPYRVFARPVRSANFSGAGDTFISSMALALAAGASPPQAAEIAVAAAAVVVGKERTAICFAQELRDYADVGEKRLTDASRLEARIAFHRQQGQRIIFTNGCFDILHRGHIAYLNRAKALGDLLIVGINTDASVRRLKGNGRPINTLEDRIQVLAALSSVDYLVPFDADTPAELIRTVRPDIFVKGGDYTREALPEAPLVEELGGAVQILPYLENRSTTSVIERIRSSSDQMPAEMASEAV